MTLSEIDYRVSIMASSFKYPHPEIHDAGDNSCLLQLISLILEATIIASSDSENERNLKGLSLPDLCNLHLISARG